MVSNPTVCALECDGRKGQDKRRRCVLAFAVVGMEVLRGAHALGLRCAQKSRDVRADREWREAARLPRCAPASGAPGRAGVPAFAVVGGAHSQAHAVAATHAFGVEKCNAPYARVLRGFTALDQRVAVCAMSPKCTGLWVPWHPRASVPHKNRRSSAVYCWMPWKPALLHRPAIIAGPDLSVESRKRLRRGARWYAVPTAFDVVAPPWKRLREDQVSLSL